MWRRVQSRNEVIGAGWVVKAMVICFFVGASCAGYLWQKSQVHELGTEIRSLERELDRLEKGNEVLRQQYSVLSSPQELDRRVDQFGLDLRSPAPEQILRIRGDGAGSEVSMARSYGQSIGRLGRRD